MQGLFPEGHAFTHALVALTWLDLAAEDHALAPHAAERAQRAYEALQSPVGRAPFPAELTPAYGIFHTAWSVQVLARGAQLTGQPLPARAALPGHCDALQAALRAGVWLEAYPGQAWPVDSVVGASSLVHCTRALGDPAYAQTATDWARRAKNRAPVVPHTPSSTARGTSLALTLRFLPDIDPAWADELYRVFRNDFLTTRAGWPGVQEHPDGRGGTGDIDSGPLPLGISVAATVVGAGVAQSMGDQRFADAIFGVGEALAMGGPSWHGRTWAFGQLPVGEAFVAWSEAAPVVRPARELAPPWWWRPLFEGPLWFGVCLGLGGAVQLWRGRPARPPVRIRNTTGR
jgi:hypothetical protein